MAQGLHRDRIDEIANRLGEYEQVHGQFPGIDLPRRRMCLCEQIVSSIRRIEYIRQLQLRDISAERSNPHSSMFDPIKAAILLLRQGHLDEAVWLTFVQTHFGKHANDEWKLAKNIYGSFGQGPIWTYQAYTAAPNQFDEMLLRNQPLLSDMAIAGRFSNHRKYQSKNPLKIARTFQTFQAWQSEFGDFRGRLVDVHKRGGQEPTQAFHELYNSMEQVSGFGKGRLGRFDFLTMIGKLELAPIEPGSVYLDKATGPLLGSRLLFFGDKKYKITGKRLQARVDALDEFLDVGKQVIEDSLCNWQKSPDEFVYFRG